MTAELEEEDRRVGPERRADYEFTDEQIEKIAARAYEMATEKIYREIGKGVVRAAVYILGAAILAIGAWLGFNKDIFPKP